VSGRRLCLQRRPRLENPELLRSDLVRIDAGALQPLAILLDAEAPFGKAVGVPSPQGALLDEPPVEHDEPDRDAETCEASPGGGAAPADSQHDPETDRAGDQAEGDREPGRHRVGPGQRKARQRTGDERDEQRGDHGSEHAPAA
jgi:hypothetical protein